MNRAYLLSLDEALRDLSPESSDEHVTDLAKRVRAIIAREEGKGGESEALGRKRDEAAAAAARHEFSAAKSVDEQEETEKVQ